MWCDGQQPVAVGACAVAGGSNHTNSDGDVVDGAPTQVDELRQPAAARRGGGRHAAPARPKVPRACTDYTISYTVHERMVDRRWSAWSLVNHCQCLVHQFEWSGV